MRADQCEQLVPPGANGLSPTAFRDLYEANFDLIWNMLVRFGVPESDASDQAQQVFLTAYLRFESFEGRSEVRTWLCGISRCVASDYRRSARYRHELLCSTIEFDLLELGAAEDVSQGSTKRLAEAVLDKLPDEQRVVFVLYELEEMQGREIAELLDISLGTMRSRLRLARQAFSREVKRVAAALRLTGCNSGSQPRAAARFGA